MITGKDITKVWDLRKAGLGLLSNVPGNKKSVTVIEDTAVNVNVLPAYMDDFQEILNKYKLDCTYHAHIGSGELHLRPILNLKKDIPLISMTPLSSAVTPKARSISTKPGT